MPIADRVNADGTHCWPECLESFAIEVGKSDEEDVVKCSECGALFTVWTEYRPHQCSASLSSYDRDEAAIFVAAYAASNTDKD